MIQTIQPAILTPTSNENATQPRWAFLFNNISEKASTRLNYIGLSYMFIGLVAIGCEAYMVKSSFRDQLYSEIFGIQLFTFGLFVVLLCRHQVYVLISVYILGFFQMISLVRKIVIYSIELALIIEKNNETSSTSSHITTIKALIITCLICALFAFILVWETLIVAARECQIQPTYAMQVQPVSIAYINQAHVPFAS